MVSIIVVFPKAEDAKNIRNILVRSGYRVAAVCTSGAQVLQVADRIGEGIVVCGYKFSDVMYSDLLADLPESFEMLLIASRSVLELCDDRGIVCLELPLKIHDLANTLEMMMGNLLRRKKRKKLQPKVRSEEEIRLIADAKRLLMERNSMTEEEAHRYMQKCSMDSGTNIVETAQMVFALMKY
ncbi:ANTAR domain-containing response regulator [Marvinbryantia formatexigens]|uniref:ANTAR domain-containing response regulator n=1 Tax=Marvinbryantia formatexigens TaxID=168384 RepID=UPI0002E60052|nr:ANTAR domain-containing protein [Marvinbryantia formatexigens]UWO23956.1 ANTAR domain-containing protein [Marvinbryantia formatexigens DSM 14469]SDH10485.1 response regulator NasT [Marvinbryantia formatexigens]